MPYAITHKNNKYIVFGLLFLLISLSIPSKALTIVAKLKAKQYITFFFGGENFYRFRNVSERDSTIIRHIPIQKLTEFRYSVGFTKDNKITHIRHTMLLSPTDSLVFKREDNELIPINKTPSSIFLDQHIAVGYTAEFDFTKKISASTEFENYLNDLSKKFSRDSIKVDSLYHSKVIGIEEKRNWVTFSKIHLIAKTFKIAEDNSNIKPDQEKYDALFNEAINNIDFQDIDGDLVNEMFSLLCNYWLKQNNKDRKSKPLDFIDFYLNHLDKINRDYIYGKFMRYVRNVPKKNSLEYTNNIERIRQYAGEYDQKLLSAMMVGKAVFFDMDQVNLIDSKNNMTTLKNVFENAKEKYFLIDMWASWCAPCRQQLPFFEKFKKELEGKNIRFLSISTDKDEKDWIKAMKEEGTDAQPFQYRLANTGGISALTRFFEIFTLPRYLVLSKGGKVVNDRFYLPTDTEFKPEILKILTDDR
ncbi:TlpA disulfide reductase family protein [Pedobacter sp. KR3-3]|uniref:TlpA disulfide reductase family protein n=1 Tax=Pedobacter albus TaxID=3113905 RepID=A0ABU7I6G9_9SPHI|nr:TlpA disulfide reductase family protein [Pedobacter sp. KR3-3]MEE1945070.1 TlpA disulfide reductase family protein [Pedobacter sp. KR3-3]